MKQLFRKKNKFGDRKRLRWPVIMITMLGVGFAIPQSVAANSALLQEVSVASHHLATVKNQPFTLRQGSRTWTVPAATAQTWYKTRGSGEGTVLLQLRPGAIYDYLNIHVSPRVNDLGRSSRFSYVGTTLHLLEGGRKGSIVDGVKTSLAIRSALAAGKTSAAVAMKEYRPGIFSAQDFTKLSFPHHLGRGESNFAGSPRNRVHNIRVAVARYNGLIMQPGDEFSFNNYLGAVDAANGYLPELVIKENVTTPEFGGGICQVSTTAFRAALQAGLDVTLRRNHSYPVAYYGTPGYDATIYPPSTDLRFTNDTGSPVHLRTSIIGTKVIFDVWGTADGRTVQVNGPFVTKRFPDGSLTAAVAQIVKQGGKSIREENFVSHYQSPDKFPTVRQANGEY
ncbi:MAG: VanW family protein [Candidatus Andersenbacteria bacterium]